MGSQLNKTDLLALINSTLTNNTTGQNSSQDVKDLMIAMVDSDYSENVIVVNELSDLGTPSGGRYLLPAAKYIFNKNIDFGTTGINLVTLNGKYQNVHNNLSELLYSGTDPFVVNSNTGQIIQWEGGIIKTPNATAMSLSDGSSLITNTLVFDGCKKVLELTDFFFLTIASGFAIVNCDNGIDLINTAVCTMTRFQWSAGNDAIGAKAISVSGTGLRIVMSGVECDAKTNESIFDIDPSYTGQIAINGGVFTNSGGQFFTAAGKDQTDVGVSVLNLAGVPNSKTIGSVTVQNNTTETIISAVNTWTDFNFGGLAQLTESNERFILLDTTTGELQIKALEDFEGAIFCTISGYGAGSASEYQFRAVVDDVPLTPISIISANEISSTMSATAFLADVPLITDKRVRLQLQNVTNNSNFIAKFVTYRVQ